MARISTPQSSCDKLIEQKKHRKHTERSRLGCTTCRIRKIKCDQGRPFCERCTSTGRRCEGPAVQGFQFVHEDTTKLIKRDKSPWPLLMLQPNSTFLDLRERRAFYFFIERAAPTLSGAFDTGFWSRIVPQISHAEPAVRNTLLIIGQLFDTPLIPQAKGELALKDVPANQQQAYKWYSNAVSELQSAINRGPQSIALALLCCLLFICVEYQLHNASRALLLLQKGIALLEAALDDTHNDIATDPASSAILASFVPFFSQRSMIAANFGQPPPAEWNIDANSLPEPFQHVWSSIETLEEARVSLYSLMYQGNAFLRITWLLNTYPTPAPSLVAGQREMAGRIDDWRTNYLRLCDTTGLVDNDTTLTNYLLMYHSVLKVWVATCTSPYQTAFDLHFASFEDILERAEAIKEKQHEGQIRSPFAAEMGIVPPLYFVATKCRHPLLRRKALSLLESAPRLEGIWRALPTIKVVRKIIELEEGGLNHHTDLYSTKTALPEEANRIHHLEIIPHTSSKPMSKPSLRVLRVALGTNGQRYMREDVLPLEPRQPVSSTSSRALARCPMTTPYLDKWYLTPEPGEAFSTRRPFSQLGAFSGQYTFEMMPSPQDSSR